MNRGPKNKIKSQSERFKEAAREHGAQDGPDIDEVMRRLAAQKREKPSTVKPEPKSPPKKRNTE